MICIGTLLGVLLSLPLACWHIGRCIHLEHSNFNDALDLHIFAFSTRPNKRFGFILVGSIELFHQKYCQLFFKRHDVKSFRFLGIVIYCASNHVFRDYRHREKEFVQLICIVLSAFSIRLVNEERWHWQQTIEEKRKNSSRRNNLRNWRRNRYNYETIYQHSLFSNPS